MTRFVTLLALLALFSGIAMADPAIVINRGTLICGMAGSDEDGNVIYGGSGDTTLILENDDKVMIVCKGTDLINLSGRAQSWSGLFCSMVNPSGDRIYTTDSHCVISADGNGSGQCTFKKP